MADSEKDLGQSIREVEDRFGVPEWLQSVGLIAWSLIGIGVVVIGALWLLDLTQVIVAPLATAGIVAAVTSPMVSWMARHHVPRAIGSLFVVLLIIVFSLAMLTLVVASIVDQADQAGDLLEQGRDLITGWGQDLGLSSDNAQSLASDASSALSGSISTLMSGVLSSAAALSSVLFFVAMTLLILYFLLSDGPSLRAWTERQMGVPLPLARTITGQLMSSLRGYFVGVTIVAVFSAIVVGVGGWLMGIPLIWTIVAVTFVGGFIPYLGAFIAGAFAVLIALGGAGVDAAIAMLILQVLANSLLQQLVQPFAMGVTLGIHPLAVLIVTLAGGALFGTIGLILSAPLVAAGVGVLRDVRAARISYAATVPPPAGTDAAASPGPPA
jgi:predicted PurR-regulated permease PerM